MIDIYHSRRSHFNKCFYWVREEDSYVSPNEWVLKERPNGIFYAKEINSLNKSANPVANVMMFDKNMLTITTNDDIPDICRGCVVKYRGEIWVVDGVQSDAHIKEGQFSQKQHYTYYLSLRK